MITPLTREDLDFSLLYFAIISRLCKQVGVFGNPIQEWLFDDRRVRALNGPIRSHGLGLIKAENKIIAVPLTLGIKRILQLLPPVLHSTVPAEENSIHLFFDLCCCIPRLRHGYVDSTLLKIATLFSSARITNLIHRVMNYHHCIQCNLLIFFAKKSLITKIY